MNYKLVMQHSRTFFAMFAIALSASFANGAQAQSSCGLSGSGGSTSIQYDPFSSAGLQSVDIPLTLTRVTAGGGKKTQEAYFVLTKPAGSPAYQIQATVPGGGTYFNVLYDAGSIPSNLPTISNTQTGQIAVQFGGAAQPDFININLRVTVPANTDLIAGGVIQFGIRYVCKGTGGLDDVLTPIDNAAAISINVNVLSALRASYVGTALDFGELAQVTDAQASTVRTSAANYVRVQSSGPYQVSLGVMSGDAQPYTLTPSGGSTTDAAQQIRYSVRFLGENRSPTATTAITKTCARAGIGDAVEDRLPVQGTLIDGGSTKAISPSYSENLVVTIAPLVAGTAAPTDCGSIAL
ncbi:MAG: hypothetical protein ACO1OX_10410 [Novosphingobium sp.]